MQQIDSRGGGEPQMPYQNQGQEWDGVSESVYSKYDALNFGGRVQSMKSQIQLNENFGTRNQEEYEMDLQ